MNTLAGLPIGIKVVGGIVATATAVAVPTVIIVNNANNVPETPQTNMVQQIEPEKPTREVAVVKTDNREEALKATTKPVKVEQPAPQPIPAPTPTREELITQSFNEFKATTFWDKTTGKEFLDKLREAYVRKPHPSTIEHVYSASITNARFLMFAIILKKHGIIDRETVRIGYKYIAEAVISGNY